MTEFSENLHQYNHILCEELGLDPTIILTEGFFLTPGGIHYRTIEDGHITEKYDRLDWKPALQRANTRWKHYQQPNNTVTIPVDG